MMRPTLVHNFLNPEEPPQVVNIRVDNNQPPQVADLIQLWPVKKILTARDVNYSQIVLPRDQVEDFILPKLLPEEQGIMNRGEQLQITVRDMNTESEHRLSLWENGSSYVLTTGWSSSFVRRRELLIGEEVGFCWDERLKMLRFSVLSRPPPPPPPVPQPAVPGQAQAQQQQQEPQQQ